MWQYFIIMSLCYSNLLVAFFLIKPSGGTGEAETGGWDEKSKLEYSKL